MLWQIKNQAEDSFFQYADLTGDGKDDRIEVDMEAVRNPKSEDESSVKVFSGETQKEIWSRPVNVIHGGWAGIYLYHEGTRTYLLVWKPEMWLGAADYQWRVFSLTEDGKEMVIASDEFIFDVARPKKSDPEDLEKFAEGLNQYLKNAFLVIDTNEGTVLSGNGAEGKAELYDPSVDISNIQEGLK